MDRKKRPDMKSSTDITQTLARAQAGNSDAWGELYEQYAPAIYRFCRHTLLHHEDAEDATAEIFLKLRHKLDQYDPQRPFSPWLYRIAANHCWDMMRRRNRQSQGDGEEILLQLEHPDSSQLDQLIDQQTGTQVRMALDGLPERARMALVLRYYAELSYDEIAATLQLPRQYVGVILLRARHQMRELMEQGGAR